MRRPGAAHAAAILSAFIMVVNFEVGLVNYPPHQIGKGVGIAVSGLSGFSPWIEKLIAGNGFKLSLVVILLALAAAGARRGTDEGWRPRLRGFRAGLSGYPGRAAVGGCIAISFFSVWMSRRYVTEGGVRTPRTTTGQRRSLGIQPAASPGRILGGRRRSRPDMIIPSARELRGQWRLEGVRVDGPELHASLPTGFELLGARVEGKEVAATADNDHLSIPLDGCRGGKCAIDISWRLPASGWEAGDHETPALPSWLAGDSFWLRARDVMPRLGLDADRVVRTPKDRIRLGLSEEFTLPAYRACLPDSAVAPSGRWSWKVEVAGRKADARGGRINGLLDFAALLVPDARETRVDGIP